MKHYRAFRSAIAVTVAVVALIAGGAVPAYAGSLTSASFTASTPYTYTNAGNTRYDWGFTTATTSTLSKVTMGVPAGTLGTNRYLQMTGTSGNYASTPDSVANSITGDIDIRLKASTAWTSNAGVKTLVAKRLSSATSYQFRLETGGTLTMLWSTDGTTTVQRTSSVATGISDNATAWVRATLDVDNGSGGSSTTFYTSTDGSTWNQLGTVQNGGSVTSIADTVRPLEIGSRDNGTSQIFIGKVYYAEVRNGINGTVAGKFDPADASTANSWTSSSPQTETWTVNRSGTNMPADIATDLTVGPVSGVPTGGTANYRFIDGIASYYFPAATSIPASTPCTINLGGFTNTATTGSYSSLIQTWDNSGTPAVVDSATTATLTFTDYSSSNNVSATVDPSMTFTVAGRSSTCNGQSSTNFQTSATATAVSLGHVTASTVGGGAQDITVSTNAANGFSVTMRTSGTTPNSLRDGNGHSIADVSGTAASPGSTPTAGTAGFGYTTNDTSTAFTSNTWAKLTNSNDSVLIGSAGTNTKAACIGFEVAIASTTPAGAYSTTVVYTALPLF